RVRIVNTSAQGETAAISIIANVFAELLTENVLPEFWRHPFGRERDGCRSEQEIRAACRCIARRPALVANVVEMQRQQGTQQVFKIVLVIQAKRRPFSMPIPKLARYQG